MLINYLKTAFRHFTKHKSYVLINVAGLGIALALCIVAYLNWKFDADFDHFHSKSSQLFRVYTIKSNNNLWYGVAPAPLAASAKSDIAGVKDAIAFDIWGASVNVGEKAFYEDILFTGPNFFQWFDFPIVSGKANLEDPSSVLITERAAEKYFPKQDPLGKTITLYSEPFRQRDLNVSGVVATPPRNSSIYFDFITNPSNQINRDAERILDNDWKTWRDATFLVLEHPEDKQKIAAQLNQYVPIHQEVRPDFNTRKYLLDPLEDTAHNAEKLRWNALQQSTPPSAVWGNLVMAILLLLTACLNFANTTVSLAGKRLREIGVRKVLGGSQRQLIGQLLLESLLISLLGLGFGLIVAEWVVEWYNQMWIFIDLKINLLANLPLQLFLLATVVVTTLLAGAYPAFYISSFNPNRIFRGSVKFGGSNLFSRVLLGIQVAISLIAIVAGLAFVRNAHFQQTADLGYQRDGVQTVFTGNKQSFTVMENEIKRNPMVLGTAGVRNHIGNYSPRYEFQLKGDKHETEYMEIGKNYLELMNVRTAKGRAFDPSLNTDYERAIMINEKFAQNFFGKSDPMGLQLTFFDTLEYTIIGVVHDFMVNDFFSPLQPLVLKLSKADRFRQLAVRSKSGDMLALRTALTSSWKKHFPNKPFDHKFQDDYLASSLEVTNNIKHTMLAIAIVTLLLTITGLYALLSLNIMKRMKEIAVRRILGASLADISYLLNRNYIWIILLGIIAGCGLGGWLSFTLLDAIYNVHAGVNTTIMILSGGICLLVVGFTIGLKLWSVMKVNPADVLKD